MTPPTQCNWLLYIIQSSDNKLYTGITTDLAKRWHAHLNTKQGAKFFRGRTPEKVLYVETGFNRSSASQREAAIKKLTRAQKLELIATQADSHWHKVFDL